MSEAVRHVDHDQTIVFGAGALDAADDLLGNGYTLLTTARAPGSAPALVDLTAAARKIQVAAITVPRGVSALRFYFTSVPAGGHGGFVVQKPVMNGQVAQFTIDAQGDNTLASSEPTGAFAFRALASASAYTKSGSIRRSSSASRSQGCAPQKPGAVTCWPVLESISGIDATMYTAGLVVLSGLMIAGRIVFW